MFHRFNLSVEFWQIVTNQLGGSESEDATAHYNGSEPSNRSIKLKHEKLRTIANVTESTTVDAFEQSSFSVPYRSAL